MRTVFPGQNIGSENVAQKIIDLSKKNRDLTAEVESYRTKYRQAQTQIQRLDSEVSFLSVCMNSSYAGGISGMACTSLGYMIWSKNTCPQA